MRISYCHFHFLCAVLTFTFCDVTSRSPENPHDGQRPTPLAPPCPPPPLKACRISRDLTQIFDKCFVINKQIQAQTGKEDEANEKEKCVTQAPVQPC